MLPICSFASSHVLPRISLICVVVLTPQFVSLFFKTLTQIFSETARLCDRLSDGKIFGYSYSQSRAKIVNHNNDNNKKQFDNYMMVILIPLLGIGGGLPVEPI